MMKMEHNPPAFPIEIRALAPGEPHQPGAMVAQFPGMTLRDWFAGQALVGLMSNSIHDHCPLFGSGEPFARDAYIVADAMLAERERKSK